MGRKILTIEAINKRLKAARVGLVVVQRGDKLSLRGTLPPKPGSTKVRPHQQLISLGVYANPAGLEYAEAKALEYGALIAQKRFSWLAIEGRSDADSCARWIERYKDYVFKNLINAEGKVAELTWKNNYYYPGLAKLNPSDDLCSESIIKAVQTTSPNTAIRQRCCIVLSRFARFAGIDVNLAPYRGTYNSKSIKRDIPSDPDIESAIDSIKNPKWQWVAAMMATYGLRNHECWYASLELQQQDNRSIWMCQISDGKTGERKSIPPLPPDWVERWQLWNIRPPKISGRINNEYGKATSRYFARIKYPHKLYSYRHAFAIRAALKYQFPTAVAAKWLGHDPSMYLDTYQRHINESQATQVFFKKIDD